MTAIICGDGTINNYIYEIGAKLAESNDDEQSIYSKIKDWTMLNDVKHLIDDLRIGCCPPPDIVVIAGQDMLNEKFIDNIHYLVARKSRVILFLNLVLSVRNALSSPYVKILTLHSATNEAVLITAFEWACSS